MNNLMESVRRFFKNKNTVTILGVLIILVLLYIGYSTQINRAVNPISVPVATETIQPRTEITSEMVQMVEMPAISVGENVYDSSAQVIGKYSNVNAVIPAGSMFYRQAIITKDELPDAAFSKVKDGQIVYSFPVDMDSTYGNSIFPGSEVDIYMSITDDNENVRLGKLISNVEVLAVKDSAGKAVFENTSEERMPAFLTFGLDEKIWLLLQRAARLEGAGVELFPVPVTGSVESNGASEVSNKELEDYIDSRSTAYQTVQSTTQQTQTDALAPTFKETGGNPNRVTITYPDGCGSTYTCTYLKDNGKAQTVTKNSVNVNFTGNGSLVATVTEQNGTAHTNNLNVAVTNSTAGNGE